MDSKTYVYTVDGIEFEVTDMEEFKLVRSPEYNYNFDKNNGFFVRWGKDENDDPQFSPIGPELLDIEISVNGCPNNCDFCYKSNSNGPPTNMAFETFKEILDKTPKTLAQIAFGITGIQTNPDFFRMMEYTRELGVVPNFTLTGIDLTPEIAKRTVELVGALAVSVHANNKDLGYNTVKTFTDLGLRQTNIHLLASKETKDFLYEVIEDKDTDERLKNLNAMVFLCVKPKGRAVGNYHSLNKKQYAKLTKTCLDKNIPFGFDSCSAPKFDSAVEASDMPKAKKEAMFRCSESCESTLFSYYISAYGTGWSCSFCENEDPMGCVSVVDAKEFLKDIWYSDPVVRFRNNLLDTSENGVRFCPQFPEINDE